MLCELGVEGGFLSWWIALTVAGVLSLALFSTPVFYLYYWRPTYETWKYKTNPQYPTPQKIRSEVLLMLKGVCTATLCPTLSLWLSHRHLSQAYCGWGGYSVPYHVLQFFLIWIISDVFEFAYHRLGHITRWGWNNHKDHHQFSNPSPFAVIADSYVDQFIRSLPLLVFPMVMPINMDLLFSTFAIFFYAYGTYLHWGFEFSFLTAHNPIINTSYHHHLHHAKSIIFKPLHTGFFFKLWDNLFGSVYNGPCECAACEIARGNRSEKVFDKIDKPDYSVLLSPAFWMNGKK